jgi:hypothetical protein
MRKNLSLSLSLWEQQRHKVFEKLVLRRRWCDRGIERCIMRHFIHYTLYQGHPNQKAWVGGAGRRLGRGERCINKILWKTEWKYHYGKQDMNGWVILQWVENRQCQIKLSIHVAHHGSKYLESISSGKIYVQKVTYTLLKANSPHLSETEHKKHIQGASLP